MEVVPRRQHVISSLIYVAVGFVPIATLAASLLELAPLHIAGPLTTTFAISLLIYRTVVDPHHLRLILRGFGAGIVAVLIYDCTRLPFVVLGGWPDFIPRIGGWLLNDPGSHWSIGYLWRYLGNGGGMGLAFTVLSPYVPSRIGLRRAGLMYGVIIWSGLLTTLALAPRGQEKMFVLTPASFALSLVGHLVYGGVLGLISHRLQQGRRGRYMPTRI